MTCKKILPAFFGTVFLLYGLSVQGQQRSYDTTTIKLFDEIDAIESAYVLSNHIAFTATYFMEDIDSVTVRDTSVAQFEVNGEKFHLQIDSIVSIQNDYYFGTIYYDNKALVVQKPVSLPKQVLGINVKDPIFQQLAMTSMTSSDSGIYRKITVHFDTYAPFTKYEVVYTPENHRVSSICYSLRKDQDSTSTKRVNMNIKFTSYSTGSFDDTVFSTDGYFTVKSSAEIVPGTSIADFEVINMINNN